MKIIKNIAIYILTVFLFICVFWYFSFNPYFDGCTVPCEEKIECNECRHIKRKDGTK